MAPTPSFGRRAFLKTAGLASAGSIAFGTSPVVATTDDSTGSVSGGDELFPPSGTTSWGESVALGDGTVSTFTSVTPSGNPQYVGVYLSPGAFENLPTNEEIDGGSGVIPIPGGYNSKVYPLAFPDDVPTPIEFMGFGWNPAGHPMAGVYDVPHFDVHFYFHDEPTIRSILPGQIDLSAIATGQVPPGYILIEHGAVIPGMGAHLAPADSPELQGGEFTNTLIWGAANLDGDSTYELNFVEPMITVEYFQQLEGVDRRAIAQPDVYPMPGWYPTAYSSRALDDGSYVVAMQNFAYRDA